VLLLLKSGQGKNEYEFFLTPLPFSYSSSAYLHPLPPVAICSWLSYFVYKSCFSPLSRHQCLKGQEGGGGCEVSWVGGGGGLAAVLNLI
jgi:hypothetical protein